jgi:hypothetical protein
MSLQLWLKPIARNQCHGTCGLLAVALAVLLGSSPRAHADFNLNIVPTFAPNIMGDPNAPAIEGAINNAVNYYNSTFTTHFNAGPINILFQEGGGLGGSSKPVAAFSYSSFLTQLTMASSGDATDTTALAHLPPGPNLPAALGGGSTVELGSANARALGFAFGTTSDGTITLNTALTTPGSPGSTNQFSLFAVAQHEIDEILGFGSALTTVFSPFPQDLYRYDSSGTGTRNFTTAGDNAFFSLDGINNLVQFNNRTVPANGGDYADWHSSGTVRVQDWAATPGSTPTLATDAGLVEIVSLDAIGYNLAPQAAGVPEPATVTLLSTGALLLSGCGWWRRKQRAEPIAA